MITTGNSNGPLGFGDEDEEDKVVEDLENGTDKRSPNDRREEVLADPVQFSNAPHVSPDQGDHTKPPTGGDEVITPREGEGGEQIVRQIPSSSHIPVDSEGEDQARSTEGMAGPASSVVEQGLGNLAGAVFTIGHDILPSSRRTSSPVHPSDPSNEPLATTVPSSDDEMPRPTARLPRATRAASSQAGSTSIERMRRRVPVVEIPLMPLDRIRQYINVPRSSLPTLQSRHKLLNESISVDTSSRASSSRPRPVRAAARRGSSSRKQSSPLFTGDSDEFGGYGSEDDEDEIFEAETGNSESDVVLLRRSGRGPEPEKVIRKSARVAKRSVSLMADLWGPPSVCVRT